MKNLRKRRQELRYQQNRNFILEVAEEIFARFGYSQTSMDQIAQEAQFSKATLYRYFKGKQELFFHVILNALQELTSQLEVIRRRNISPEKKIKECVACIFHFYQHKMNIGRAFFLEKMISRKGRKIVLENHPPRIPPILRKRFQEISEILSSIIREGIEAGVFEKVDEEDASFVLGSLIRGFVFRGPLQRKEYSAQRASELVSQYFLFGIARNRQDLNPRQGD
jgi:AcrR family transcriptional regulator